MNGMKDWELKEIFLDKILAMGWDKPCPDYKMRKMAQNLQEQFDIVWLDYLKGNATYNEWEKALDGWLNVEMLA